MGDEVVIICIALKKSNACELLYFLQQDLHTYEKLNDVVEMNKRIPENCNRNAYDALVILCGTITYRKKR